MNCIKITGLQLKLVPYGDKRDRGMRQVWHIIRLKQFRVKAVFRLILHWTILLVIGYLSDGMFFTRESSTLKANSLAFSGCELRRRFIFRSQPGEFFSCATINS